MLSMHPIVCETDAGADRSAGGGYPRHALESLDGGLC